MDRIKLRIDWYPENVDNILVQPQRTNNTTIEEEVAKAKEEEEEERTE